MPPAKKKATPGLAAAREKRRTSKGPPAARAAAPDAAEKPQPERLLDPTAHAGGDAATAGPARDARDACDATRDARDALDSRVLAFGKLTVAAPQASGRAPRWPSSARLGEESFAYGADTFLFDVLDEPRAEPHWARARGARAHIS